jgi:hypothetical protein
MYGKIFEQTFQLSMYGAGSHVFAVWAYVIANTKASRVRLNPKELKDCIGDTIERMEEAIKFLSSPDSKSTHPEHEGRRIVQEGPFQYYVPNHERYRGIQNTDQLDKSNRIRQQRYRDKKKAEKAILPSRGPSSAREKQAEVDDGAGQPEKAEKLAETHTTNEPIN